MKTVWSVPIATVCMTNGQSNWACTGCKHVLCLECWQTETVFSPGFPSLSLLMTSKRQKKRRNVGDRSRHVVFGLCLKEQLLVRPLQHFDCFLENLILNSQSNQSLTWDKSAISVRSAYKALVTCTISDQRDDLTTGLHAPVVIFPRWVTQLWVSPLSLTTSPCLCRMCHLLCCIYCQHQRLLHCLVAAPCSLSSGCN